MIEDTSFMSLFSVKIVLTELGVTKYEQVIGMVFGFISLLNEEPSLHLYYEEMREIHHTEFRFQHKNNGPEYAINLLTNRFSSSSISYPSDSLILLIFSSWLLAFSLRMLLPISALIQSFSRSMWMRQNLCMTWNMVDCRNDVRDEETNWILVDMIPPAQSPLLHVPAPNRFVCSQFGMLHGENQDPSLVWLRICW